MNKVELMGRLTRDPEVRYTTGDTSTVVAKFTLAVDRRRNNANGEREADFISCVAFSKSAEFAEKYLSQGTKIVLIGRIQTGSYINKDGARVYTTDVIAEDIEFAESKAASGGQKAGASQAQVQAQTMPQKTHPVGEGFMNFSEGVGDDGLPFN